MTANIIQRLVTILLLSITTIPLYAQTFPWSIQTQILVPHGEVSFEKIDAPRGDTLHAMAIGAGGDDNVVCRTTDGGTTWDVPLHRVFLEPKIQDLSHPTPRVAVIVGDTMYRDTGITVFYTHDGGDTWQQGWCDSCLYATGQRPFLWRVSMCDSLNGIMGTSAFILARTTDGGATWRRISIPTSGLELTYGLQCLSPSTYILSASVFRSGISSTYRTTDSGRTWTHNVVARGTGTPHFIDLLHGWSAGYWTTDSMLYNMVARTTDGGVTWDTLLNAEIESKRWDQNVYRVEMADATHGIATGSGGTWLYTTNGSTWRYGASLDSIFSVFNLTSVTYPHPDKAWATDVRGHVLVYRPRTATVPFPSGPASTPSIAVYPNPITSGSPVSISITSPGSAPIRLSLVDVRGATIATIDQPSANTGTNRFAWLPPAWLPVGTYFLRVIAGASASTIPVTVLH